MENVELSIVIPVYNAEKYIEDTIKSILDQTYKNWELILVNDGSKDESQYICEKLALKDKRIKLISKENSGVSDSRNTGIKAAQGKYIGFVDSDDLIEKDMFEKMILNFYESEIIICGYKIRTIKGKIIKDSFRKPSLKGIFFLKEIENIFMEEGQLFNSVWNKFYLTEIIKKNKIFFKTDLKTGEDLVFNLNYLSCIRKVSFLDENLYIYFKRENESITHSYIENAFERLKIIYKELENFVKKAKFSEEKCIKKIDENFIQSIFFQFLNLEHKKCPLNFKEKIKYIERILNDEYLNEIKKRTKIKKTKNLILKITNFLISTKNSIFIYIIFKLIRNILRIKKIIKI